MNSNIIQRVADGRADQVFQWVSDGHAANSTDQQGVALIKWCAYYGDVTAIFQFIPHDPQSTTMGLAGTSWALGGLMCRNMGRPDIRLETMRRSS